MAKLSSTDNHYRLAISEIKKKSRESPGKQLLLLEVGAGAKIIKDFIPSNVTYHTLDNAESFWNETYTFSHNLNGGKFPIKDGVYDILICNDTLEHVLYPEKVIEEMKRVAKKDAIFFISLPNEYNFVMRLYYLFAIKTKVDETWKVVTNGLHIYKPRVKDIISLFSKHFAIRKVDYVWQSRNSYKSGLARFADKAISLLAKTSPSLFCRTVAAMTVKKTEY